MDDPSTSNDRSVLGLSVGNPGDQGLGFIGVRLRFDEKSRTWETYAPLFDKLYRGAPSQEEALSHAREGILHGLAAAQAYDHVLRFHVAQHWWYFVEGACVGFMAGGTVLLGLRLLPFGLFTAVASGLAVLAIVADVLFSRLHRRSITKWQFPKPRKVGEDGWPVDQDSTGAIK